MNIKFFVLALFILSSSTEAKRRILSGTKCVQLLGSQLFTLSDLESKEDRVNYFEDENDGETQLTWNLCNQVSTKCDDKTSFAYITDVSDGECHVLTSESNFENFNYTLLNESDPQQGINITYTGGEEGYGLTISLKCDYDVDDISQPKITYTYGENEEYDILLETSSKHACPSFNFSAIWEWLTENKWIGFGFLFTFGVIENFFGLRLKNFTLGAMGFIIIALLIMIFFIEFIIKTDSEDWLMWVALGTAAFFGGLAAWGTIKAQKVGFFCLGGFCGFVVGLIVYNAFLVDYDKDNNAIEIGSLVGFVLLFGAITVVFNEVLFIFTTSIIGGYSMIRACSFVIGDYPNEFTIKQQLEDKNFEFPWQFWVYLAAMIVSAIGGMVVQFIQKKQREEEEEDNGLMRNSSGIQLSTNRGIN